MAPDVAAYDAIVIGAGLNGLTAAATLGRAGRRVLVLDRRDRVGGAASRLNLGAGFSVDPVLDGCWVSREISQALNLDRHGLRWLPPDESLVGLGASGDPLLVWRDERRTVESIRRRSLGDSSQWPIFTRRLSRLGRVLSWLYHRVPPRPTGRGLRDLADLAAIGRQVRGLGRQDMTEFARLLPLPVADFADETFEHDAVKALVAASAVAGLQHGPRAAGTTFSLLHHHAGADAGTFGMGQRVAGGWAALADAAAEAAKVERADLRLATRVTSIRTTPQRVTGVVLENGDEIAAPLVLSSADARETLVHLVGTTALDPELVRSLLNVRARGVVVHVHLSLDAVPAFRGVPDEALRGPLLITPDTTGIEQAYDAAKYGGVSPRPILRVRVPTIADPTRAPAGKHIVSIAMQYAPYRLRGGAWDDAAREAAGDLAVSVLAAHAPNVPAAMLSRHVLTPRDLESEYGFPEGQADHAELGLDQWLFMRPVPECARYRTPIEGLFLCGAGMHPGRRILGAAGLLAARAALGRA